MKEYQTTQNCAVPNLIGKRIIRQLEKLAKYGYNLLNPTGFCMYNSLIV